MFSQCLLNRLKWCAHFLSSYVCQRWFFEIDLSHHHMIFPNPMLPKEIMIQIDKTQPTFNYFV